MAMAVGAVARHRVGVGQPRDRRAHLVTDECPDAVQEGLGELDDVVLLHEGHLDVELGDLLDAVGAEDYSQWATLGQALANLGLKRSRDREKELIRWLEAHPDAWSKTSKKAAVKAEGVATPPAQKKKKGRSNIAMSSFTVRDTTSKSASSRDGASNPAPVKIAGEDRIRVIPPVCIFRSIALTAPMLSNDNSEFETRCQAARAAFELGWAEGLAQVAHKRGMLRTSWYNGRRIVRMIPVKAEIEGDPEGAEDGFHGLQDIGKVEDFDIEDDRCPQICFAGPGRQGSHLEHCPHTIGWEAFKDEL